MVNMTGDTSFSAYRGSLSNKDGADGDGDKPKDGDEELGGIAQGAQKYFNTIKSLIYLSSQI